MAENETRTIQPTGISSIAPEPVVPRFAAPSVINTVPDPQASQVYSAANIAQTVTAPVKKPDLSDPFGVRDYYMNSPEIQAARAEAQRVQEAINASRQGLRTTTTALENQNDQAMGGTGASINLIGRQVGRARELTSNELAALSENQLATQSYLDTLLQEGQSKYAIAEQQRAQIQDLIRETGGKAGISYADSYESAIKKATKYQEQVKKEEEKKAYKDSLKAQLQALGKNTKGLSTNELEKKLKKYNKKALAEAKAKEEAEWNMKVQSHNKSMSSGSDKKTEIDFSNKGISTLIEQGANMGDDWGTIAATLESAAPGSTKSGSFADKYLRYLFLGEDNPLD